MGFLDGYRSAKKLRKMAEQQARQAQQGSAGDPQQLEEIQRIVAAMPQGTDPRAVQGRIEAARQIEQLQAERFGTEEMRAEVAKLVGPLPENVADPSGAGLELGKLVARFARDEYAPGDTVDGVLVAREAIKAREVTADLRYVDESADYLEGLVHGASAVLHSGSLEEGQELPFSFRLPDDALPNWEARSEPTEVKQLGPFTMTKSEGSDGHLYWAVEARVDVPRRRDVKVISAVPLSDDPQAWRGSDPGPGEPSTESVVKGWDVDVEPDRWTLRRGEELDARVTIGEPGPREGLRVGLVCTRHYDVEETSTDADGSTSTHRRTRSDDVVEQWPQIDTSAPEQTVRLSVPEDAPFGYYYKGAAFGFEWKVVAREDKRMRRDPRREAILRVLP